MNHLYQTKTKNKLAGINLIKKRKCHFKKLNYKIKTIL